MPGEKFGICVPPPVVSQLKAIAQEQGTNRNVIVNLAIAQYLQCQKSKPPAA